MKYYWLFILVSLVGCGHLQSKNNASHKPVASEKAGLNIQQKLSPGGEVEVSRQLNQEINVLNSEIDRLKEENSALKSLLSQKKVAQIKKSNHFVIPTQSEEELYNFILKSYMTQDFEKYEVAQEMFMEQSRISTKYDDVLFLKAEHLSNEGKWVDSLEITKMAIESFPLSNCRSAFMRLAVLLYRRLNLLGPAMAVIDKIEKQYPNSPEAEWLKQEMSSNNLVL